MKIDLTELDDYVETVNEAYYKFAINLFEIRGRSASDVDVNAYNSLIAFQYIFSTGMMLEAYEIEQLDGYEEFHEKLLKNCPVGNEFEDSVIEDILSKGEIYNKCNSYCKIKEDFIESIFWAQVFAVVAGIPNFSLDIMQETIQLYYQFMSALEKCVVKWKSSVNAISVDYCTQITDALNNYLSTYKK